MSAQAATYKDNTAESLRAQVCEHYHKNYSHTKRAVRMRRIEMILIEGMENDKFRNSKAVKFYAAFHC